MVYCQYVYKSGKRKDTQCTNEVIESDIYCHIKNHRKTETKNEEGNKINVKKKENINNSLVSNFDTVEILKFKLLTLDTTLENKKVITKRFKYMETLQPTTNEYQKNINWLRHALNFPYSTMIQTPVTLDSTNEDISNYISNVYEKLDSYIYGMSNVKEELLSFVCKRISNPTANNNILALHGSNGVGKTRLAHGLAYSLDLPIKTINLGCVTEVSYFTGHGFTYVDSEPGRIVQILNEVRCKNCIIYFDELDKVNVTSKGQSIFSFLTHLIDPSQNEKFQDVYLSGLELDLSKVFFVFSFNDINLIDKTVKDRLKIIKIKDHSMGDQFEIAKKFIVTDISKNLNFKFQIDDATLNDIIKRNQKNGGLRNVYRIIENIYSKLNLARMLTSDKKTILSYYDENEKKMIGNILAINDNENEQWHHSMYS